MINHILAACIIWSTKYTETPTPFLDLICTVLPTLNTLHVQYAAGAIGLNSDSD